MPLFLTACEDVFSLNLELGNGYELTQDSTERIKIILDGEVIVGPTIVSYDYNETYVIGLVLLGVDVQCPDGIFKKITNTTEYFILNLKNHHLHKYEKKRDFIIAMGVVDPTEELSIDFQKLEQTWAFLNSKYSRPKPNYWQRCQPL